MQVSNSVASFNQKILCEKELVNVQRVLSLQSRLQSIRQCVPKMVAKTKSQRKPEKKYVEHVGLSAKAKGRKNHTKNTDRSPCCSSIFPRNVSISLLVPSSPFWVLVP